MKTILVSLFGFLLAGCASFPFAQEKIALFAHTDVAWEKSTAPLARALAFCRAEKVDRVVFLGDVTRAQQKNQYEVFEKVWAKAFKGVTPPERILAKDEYWIGGTRFHSFGRLSLVDLMCARSQDGRTVNVGSMHGFAYSGLFEKADSKLAAEIDNSAQGLLVLAAGKELTIRRLDFSGKTAEDVGEPWLTDSTGALKNIPESSPEFWPDTHLSVVRGYDSKGHVIYSLRWPPVLAKHTGMRAYYYEVELPNGTVKNVVSRGFFLPESRDRSAVTYQLRESDIEGFEPRFRVRPVSSLGKVGKLVLDGKP